MINVTPQFRQALYDGNRNYIEEIQITLEDGTVLNLTNEDIWQGSLSFEDAVSSDSDFQIGTAIINKQKLRLNNMYEDFNDYTFEGAEVITNIGLACGANGEVERLRKGTFIVDTADYDETIISLDLLDYMSKFDVPFSEINITFPAQAQEIVNAICSHCGVALGTVNFPHRTFEITAGPEKETCSCREVVAWIAQICGCFARCDVYGRLELKWYDTNSLGSFLSGLDGGVFDETTSSSYQTGDTADGGSFNPWDTGYVYDDGDFAQVLKNVHVISETFSHSISVDDVVITGIRILVKRKSGTGNEIETISRGTAGYIIEISNNELITVDNVNTIADWLATQLIGLTFRKANVSIPSDPSIEAGDVGIIFDRKGNNFPILISKTVFSPFGQQTVVSSAQTPARNSAARYSVEAKNYVELRKQIKKFVDDWTAAEQRLSDAITNANGMYQTDITDPQTGAVTHYLHNKGPDGTATDQSGLNASDIRIMISDVGITMTANGTDPNPVWYGLTVDGNLIASILNTIGINFDWGVGGTLQIQKTEGGTTTETFYANADTGEVRINASSFSLTDGTTLASVQAAAEDYADEAIEEVIGNYEPSDHLTQEEVFNLLTNNGALQGIYMQNGTLYIHASYIQSGILKLGGLNNGKGHLRIYDDNDTIVGAWTTQGITVNKGKIKLGDDGNGNPVFQVLDSGAVTAKSFTANDYVYVDGDSNSVIKIPYTTYSPDGYTKLSYEGLRVMFSGGIIHAGSVFGWSGNFGDKYPSGINSLPTFYADYGNIATDSRDCMLFSCGVAADRIVNRTRVRSLWLGTDEISLSQASTYSSGQFEFKASATNKLVSVYGNFSVTGTKNRLVETEDYGNRLLYCYETPTPMFGDIGDGVIGEDGLCYISIDPVFAETIITNQYQVFLQKYGEGDCYVQERFAGYFVIKGTPGLTFGWEIKAKQAGYDQRRLDDDNFVNLKQPNQTNYGDMAIEHIDEIAKEREAAA